MNLHLKILVFIFMILYIILLYLPININYKNFKLTKKTCLTLSSFTGLTPYNCWQIFKYIHLFVLGIIPIIYFFYNNFINNYYIYPKINLFQATIVILLSFITVLEISFFVIIVIVSYLMKKDSRKEIGNVCWIKFNKKHSFYTGIITPIIYTLFEITLFYYILLYILNNYLALPIWYCFIGLGILYSISKLVLTRNKEQSLIYGTWSFTLNLIGSCILVYSNSIILTFILYLLYSFIIVFKE